MIEYRKGDLFSVQSGIIAHGCNNQGVMGSGVAAIVKRMYPLAFMHYKNNHQNGFNALGQVDLVLVKDEPKLYIGNLITQELYGNDVRQVSYDAVDICFDALFMKADKQIVNIPKIGAGLGGGDWNVIESIIKSKLKNYTKQKVVVWEL
jgi:O-acetyl-ADP-ribose deacetylase (regulator of RNase III)